MGLKINPEENPHFDYPVKIAGRFTWTVLAATNTKLPNTPPEGRAPDNAGIRGRNTVLRQLERLCSGILIPIEAALKLELIITSGYRNAAVNQAVGGDVASAHMEGRAADCIPTGLSPWLLFRELAKRRGVLPIDKVIYEQRTGRGGDLRQWVHVQIAQGGRSARRKCYLSPAPAKYTEIEPGYALLDRDLPPSPF